MKKILFICPFFGKLPFEQTNLWLNSCKINWAIDWIIITDDKTNYNLPTNVKFLYTTMEKLRENIQKNFDFKISLNNAYKLCDFKPTYGYIFPELVKGYDYWGHCDMSDCIFGNIQKFLLEQVEDGCEKIGFLGHMTLYKNTKEVNERFFLESKSGKKLNEILGISKNMAFDETFDYSINAIYKDNGFKVKRFDEIYADISTLYYPFRTAIWSKKMKWERISKEKFIFEWDNGHLYKIYIKNNEIKKMEIGYVHYQKRKFKYLIDCNNTNHYLIVPNCFIKYPEELSLKLIKKYTKNKLVNFTLIRIKWNRLINKFK